MRDPPRNNNYLGDPQYLRDLNELIRRRVSIVEHRIGRGDFETAAAILMSIHDDTAAVATAWENGGRPKRRGEQ